MQLCIQAGEQCGTKLVQASYRGEDAGEMFVCGLQEEAEQVFQEYIATPQQLPSIVTCNQPLGGDKVHDHCHIVGNYRGAVHSRCNLAYRISKFFKIFQKYT